MATTDLLEALSMHNLHKFINIFSKIYSNSSPNITKHGKAIYVIHEPNQDKQTMLIKSFEPKPFYTIQKIDNLLIICLGANITQLSRVLLD
jgi:hypothetical protein